MQMSTLRCGILMVSVFCTGGCIHRENKVQTNPTEKLVAPTTFAEKIQLRGVSNVGRVNEFLYRGSQPNDQGLKELKGLGITTIVDLRGERPGRAARERNKARELGMKFVNIHASGWSPPKDAEIAQFFSLAEEHPTEKLFVHCWLGDDRTGVFLATYRIAFQHWTVEQALAEMRYYHMKEFWHPAMIRYIRDFPQHLEESDELAGYRRPAKPLSKN
jgi:protein tyrosine/serine phosphatase